MRRLQLAIALLFAITGNLIAQDNSEFKPNGKPLVKIFSNYHTDITDGESASAFEITRAYFGYEYKFSPEFSTKLVLDVGNPAAGKLEMTAYLKNALVKYKKDRLAVEFGLIGSKQFKIQEKQWGYRYLLKSFQDQYKFGPSADLGLSVEYNLSDFVSVDFSLTNGEGYKKLQGDSIFKKGFGLTLRPVDKVVIRGYYDHMKDDAAQTSLATYIGYTADKFNIAAEYNHQKNNGMIDGRDFSGVSFYSTVEVSEKVKVYGRYDSLTSDKLSGASEGWNVNRDGDLFIAGLEYSPVRGVKLSPNYRGWSPKQDSKDFTSSLYVNLELKF
ncbi:hypothetical protein EYV94_26285 [Puteibacter caeruleilacunae]|nr:hypothetical protein EYV94_26285 [Puteibacter caeruleilacunae]